MQKSRFGGKERYLVGTAVKLVPAYRMPPELIPPTRRPTIRLVDLRADGSHRKPKIKLVETVGVAKPCRPKPAVAKPTKKQPTKTQRVAYDLAI